MHVFSLIVGESALLTFTGVAIGSGLLYGLLIVSQPLIMSRFGIFIEISAISLYELLLIVIVCLAGIVIGFIPGYRIYRYSLADGMTIKI
jgi:putative ABC transport system permease protein